METNPTPLQIDPTALALSRAIRKKESGGKYDILGDNNTSAGAYQWNNGKIPLKSGEIPANFKSAALRHKLDPNDFSPTNQDHVAYEDIKSDLDSGLTQSQIAAKHNSGLTHGWENHKGTVVINGKPIHYDTPAYVAEVQKYYQEEAQNPSQGFNPKPYSQPDGHSNPGLLNLTGNPSTEKPKEETGEKLSFSPDEKLMDEVHRRQGEISDINKSDQNIGSKVLQNVGQVAGLAGSLSNRALSAITPNFIERPIVGALEGAGKEVAKMPLVQKGIKKYGEYAQKHPEAAKNIGAVGNIAGLIPDAKALSGVIGLEKGLIVRSLEKTGLKTATNEVLDLVNPKMNSKQIKSAVVAGQGTKAGLLGDVSIKPNAKTIRAAEAVADIVDPKKTLVENVNMTREALAREAEALKNKIALQDHPYTFRELQSRLNKLEEPISLKTDEIKTFNKVKKAAMTIAKKNGGTVSSLLDARKEFDSLIAREFPTLYDRESATMKNAIRSVRDEMNNFINDNLPSEAGFRESLAKQASMFDAIDGMATKVSGEVGTNAIERLGNRHPIVKGLISRGASTTAAGGVLKATGILP